jgi:glycine oxidase
VDAIGVCALDKVGPVVQHEQCAVTIASPPERLGRTDEIVIGQLLLTKLHHIHAASERRIEQGRRIVAVRLRLEHEVEPRARQTSASVGAVHGGDTIVHQVERYDAAIVGGGIIGLASAWRAQQRGLRVCVVERGAPGCGATRAAAGVLGPDPETPGFEALARASSKLWPAFAGELGDTGYTRCGSLVLAFDGGLREHKGEWLDGESCRALEPGIAPDCRGGWLLADDAQVDPRRVVDALVSKIGAVLRIHADVVDVTPRNVELADGSRIDADRVVLAAGAWSARRLAKRLPVRPVKGQTLRLRGPLPATRIIQSEEVYVVPRASGETVLGATVEDAGFDDAPTDAATELLLRQAIRAVPAVADLEVVEASASLRPGTPDDGPLIGEWEGLLVASGHYRNGILLAPITAEAIAALLAGEEPPPETAAFDPRRFQV